MSNLTFFIRGCPVHALEVLQVGRGRISSTDAIT